MQVGKEKEKGKDDLLLWAPAIRNHFGIVVGNVMEVLLNLSLVRVVVDMSYHAYDAKFP
jgi:hypothetical protein